MILIPKERSRKKVLIWNPRILKVPVLPICLPWNTTSKGDISTKGDLFVSAWERREDDTAFFQAVKSEKVNFMAGQKCKEITAYNLISTDRHVCAGGPDGKLCYFWGAQ